MRPWTALITHSGSSIVSCTAHIHSQLTLGKAAWVSKSVVPKEVSPNTSACSIAEGARKEDVVPHAAPADAPALVGVHNVMRGCLEGEVQGLRDEFLASVG